MIMNIFSSTISKARFKYGGSKKNSGYKGKVFGKLQSLLHYTSNPEKAADCAIYYICHR